MRYQVLGCFGLRRLYVDSADLNAVLGKTISLFCRLEMLWVGKSGTLDTVQPIHVPNRGINSIAAEVLPPNYRFFNSWGTVAINSVPPYGATLLTKPTTGC